MCLHVSLQFYLLLIKIIKLEYWNLLFNPETVYWISIGQICPGVCSRLVMSVFARSLWTCLDRNAGWPAVVVLHNLLVFGLMPLLHDVVTRIITLNGKLFYIVNYFYKKMFDRCSPQMYHHLFLDFHFVSTPLHVWNILQSL